jgi:single-stranded-DNA-specific exonuclease
MDTFLLYNDRIGGERMLKSKTRWIVRPSSQEKVQALVEELNVTPLVASLLINRGFETLESASAFLFDDQVDFHDPFLINDMETAVIRIKRAIEEKEPILIFGDYDADGVTSTTVLMKTLEELGAVVQFYIPNRFTEGYGPNEGAFRYAHDIGIKLIITVDTGIAALHEANIAKELGLDLIITDHHEPGPELPDALAIIHPKRADSKYPFQELAGVGVAFKLAHALFGKVPEHLLPFAAIGTIADLVPLKDENRLIAKRGLQKLRTTDNEGLKALLKLAGAEQENLNEETVGFSIAPRINAAGRLDSADPAVYLLLAKDPFEAEALAEDIEQLNKDRQALVNQIAEEAIQMVEKEYPINENGCLVVGKEGWNAGVIGIVASKLVEKYYRPTIVLSFDLDKGIAKGSARSIAGFDLFKNLSTCRDILPHFGGHTMAAGMTLKLEDVGELRSRLNKLVFEQLTEEDFSPLTYVDAEINLEDIQLQSIEEMNKLAPYGMGNPKPKVLVKDAEIAGMKKIGSEQTHLKITLGESNFSLDGVGFGLGSLADHISPSSRLSVIGELSINEWNNIRKPQIFLQDLSVSSWQLFDYRGLKQISRLGHSVPAERTKWILFQDNLKFKFKDTFVNQICYTISTVQEAADLDIDGHNIVLLDMPPTKDHLASLLTGKKPARIYAHFYKEQSDFFSTLPTRDHFKWFYAVLMKNNPLDLNKYGEALAKKKGWKRETIDFMSKVFFELDFVTINNGLISLQSTANKRDFTESPTYRQKQAHIYLENELLYSSFPQLKSLFDGFIPEPVKLEEDMKEWI